MAFMPSPQRAMGKHACPAAAQLKPDSTRRQLAAQPSPSSLLPSSHASSSVSTPSPQPAGACPVDIIVGTGSETKPSAPGAAGLIGTPGSPVVPAGPGCELPGGWETTPIPLPAGGGGSSPLHATARPQTAMAERVEGMRVIAERGIPSTSLAETRF